MRQRQEELRITFEHMGDGVAMFDETQHLVAWNGKFQEILDVPDDIIARRQTFTEYVRYLAERGEYGPEADPEDQIRRFTENADQYRAFERIRPGGRVIEIRHNPVPGGGFVLIYADITERKRNEAEIAAARDAAEEASRTIEAAYRELKTAQANLIQAEKMASLGQLTAGIAHGIKNPLNFVNNFSALSTELIDELRDVLTPEPLGETARTEVDDLTALLKGNLEKVVQHGQRADGIVRSMLDHSRGSSGERRMVDLNALIDEALNLAYHGARAQDQSFNIMLERDFGEGIAPIEVNPQDITRVFLNIFSNGFYASTRRAREGGDAGFVPTLCCANIAPPAACQLVESSTDPDGGWHTKACHPVQCVASNLCFDLLTGQSPGEKSPSNDGFVPIHRSLNEASTVVARTTLPADATMLLDGCNMLIALRRPTRTRNRCRTRWNDDDSLRMTISHSVVDSLTIICAVCYHRSDPGRDLIKKTY